MDDIWKFVWSISDKGYMDSHVTESLKILIQKSPCEVQSGSKMETFFICHTKQINEFKN